MQNIQISQLIPVTIAEIALILSNHKHRQAGFVCLCSVVLPSYIICEVNKMSVFLFTRLKKSTQQGGGRRSKEKQAASSGG